MIDGYSTPCRLGQNSNSGGISLYVREDISSFLTVIGKAPFKSFYVELITCVMKST